MCSLKQMWKFLVTITSQSHTQIGGVAIYAKLGPTLIPRPELQYLPKVLEHLRQFGRSNQSSPSPLQNNVGLLSNRLGF